jgi:ribosomal protein L37AE/L43A
MSKINDKLGLRPAGQRNMMKLPKTGAHRAALTSAKCPACGQRGVVEHKLHGARTWMCTWCAHHWPAPPAPEAT